MSDSEYPENSRAFPRVSSIVEELSGRLTLSDGSHSQAFVLWDLSLKGMGIWISEFLEPGTKIQIKLHPPHQFEAMCEVAWCKRPQCGRGYGAGLQALSNFEGLESFVKYVQEKTTDNEIESNIKPMLFE